MIFVTVGTHGQQFNRLLKKLDELKENEKIREEIFAQTGNSDFVPKNFSFEKFLNDSDFEKKIKQSSLVISHAGAGAIITSLKYGKKLVLVPRLKKFKEHTDSHQVDLAKFMEEKKKALGVFDINDLEKMLQKSKTFRFSKQAETTTIVSALEEFFGSEK